MSIQTPTSIPNHTPTQPPRTKPLALINVGLPRTGTKSLRTALQILGFPNVYHYSCILPSEHPEHSHAWNAAFTLQSSPSGLTWSTSEWDNRLLSQYQCLSDSPCICFTHELLAAYPHAKMMMSTRDSAAVWAKSYAETILPVDEAYRSQTWNPFKLVYREYTQSRTPTEVMMENLAMYAPAHSFRKRGGERVYEEWSERMREIGETREAGFLEFNVKEGWGPLCEFLEVDVPDVPFPRLNDKAEFWKLWNMKEGAMEETDGWVWGVAAAGAMVPVVVGLWLVREGVFKT